MMAPWWLISAGAGIASAVLYGAAPPSPLGAMVVTVLITVPLFMAGLALGTAAGALASVVGILASLVVHGPVGTGIYALCFGVPTVVLVRQAMLSRDTGDAVEWYPAGLLTATLAIIGVALGIAFTAIMPTLGIQDSAEAMLRDFAERFASESGELTAEEFLDRINAPRILRLLPGMIAVSWMLALLAGSAMAQALLERFGKNLRPSPDFAGLELPNWLAVGAALIMVAALFAPDPFGAYAVSMAFAACFPFLAQGLAVVHAFNRKIQGGTILLAIFYLLVFAPAWPAVLIVLLGAVEQFAGLRRGWKMSTEA